MLLSKCYSQENKIDLYTKKHTLNVIDKLTNMFTGINKCLDVIDGIKLELRDCDNIPGQKWFI